jgi:hypothetical protein
MTKWDPALTPAQRAKLDQHVTYLREIGQEEAKKRAQSALDDLARSDDLGALVGWLVAIEEAFHAPATWSWEDEGGHWHATVTLERLTPDSST